MTMPAATTLPDYFAARPPYRDIFLRTHLTAIESVQPIGEDWGTRRYFRVAAGGHSYILMEAVPAHLPFAAQGHRIADFIKIATELTRAALHAPAIVAADPDEGYVLMEDMGDTRLWDVVNGPAGERAVYEGAVDVLRQFQTSFPENTLSLPLYRDSYIHAARRRIIDWYMPAVRGEMNADSVVGLYLSIWDEIESKLPPAPMGFVHGDFHLQNLMWLPDGAGTGRCGLLDFQDAMWGPLPYDLANLLDDIRRDVPDDVRTAMMERRMAGMAADQKEAFLAWYPVLALQFHCRIIGQVIRLALVQGKTAHLKNMPRIQAHVKRGLVLPAMAPLNTFLKDQGVTFDAPFEFDADKIRSLIRPDAF
jgi:aminoglycoside/choline kinase family phosphotransferase